LLSNLYLHYVLDLWFEHVVKPRLQGEAYLVRYIDDFVVCFQYRADALRLQDALRKRLGKFGLELEPAKTKLVLISTNVQLGITLSHWVEHTIARIMNGRTIMSMIHIQFHPALQFKSHPSTPVEYRRY